MSTIPAKETERNRDEPNGLNPACVPPANRPCDSEEGLPLRLRRRHTRVKLCSRCPYAPPDLADHYDPEGFFTCARSVTADKRRTPTNHTRPTGDTNAQHLPVFMEWRSQTLRNLRRKVRPHSILLLANRPLFKEVR